jgi:hypothetical protein
VTDAPLASIDVERSRVGLPSHLKSRSSLASAAGSAWGTPQF